MFTGLFCTIQKNAFDSVSKSWMRLKVVKTPANIGLDARSVRERVKYPG